MGKQVRDSQVMFNWELWYTYYILCMYIWYKSRTSI